MSIAFAPAWRTAAAALAIAISSASCGSAAGEKASPEVVRLWPGQAPGTASWKGPEQEVDAELPNLGKVHIVTNVTTPTLTVFRPAAKANGTAMIVIPGGAFRALPWDLDGTETASWLTRRGVTAFVLKYRVRPPPASAPPDKSFDDFVRRTEPARAIAVADAEQAIRLVRSRAAHFGIAPYKIGMIGFSAGAMTTVSVALASDPAVRPNFAVSLYGAKLSDAVPAGGAPPMFIAAAQDDSELSAEKSIAIFQAWDRASVPAELHIYEKGVHGFAFRIHHKTADRWPGHFEAWLAARGYLPTVQRGAGSR